MSKQAGLTDIEIANAADMMPIQDIAARLGIEARHLYQYGQHKAKVTRDFTNLSQLVMFSSGGDTYLEMSQGEMANAIQSQSFVSYDTNSTSADGSVSLYKPVFYYVVGGAGVGDTT